MPSRIRGVVPYLAVLLLLTGCSIVAVGHQDPAAKAEAMAAFRAGGAGFTCGQGLQCAVKWSAAKPAANRLMLGERWEDVADVVLGAGYEQDLTWFYLGIAAEGLGNPAAARAYYDNSIRRSLYGAGYSCTAAGMMSCDGVRLPDDAKALLAGLDPRGRAQARRVANPAARLGQGGGGDGARAYVQRLARMRAEEDARRTVADAGSHQTGPRQTAQAAPAGTCPTNFRC